MAIVKKWLVNAPNGKLIHVSIPGIGDTEFHHGAYITNEKVAKQFPRIFIEFEEYVEDKPSRKILTEPAPTPPVEPTKEEPVLSLEDTILTEPAPVEKLEVAENKEDEPKKKGRGRPKGSKNKPQVLEG